MSRVLFLGEKDSGAYRWLSSLETIVAESRKIDAGILRETQPDFIVSHGYRYILPADIVDKFDLVDDIGRAINLHISYLPWNRGADPNMWSWLDDTPKGVTVHYIGRGIDTGDIIAQRLLDPAAGQM